VGLISVLVFPQTPIFEVKLSVLKLSVYGLVPGIEVLCVALEVLCVLPLYYTARLCDRSLVSPRNCPPPWYALGVLNFLKKIGYPPPGPPRPSPGPKWAKKADYGGANRGGPFSQGIRPQKFLVQISY